MFSSSKKPRFNLSLRVNELSNIPQVSGSCFVRLQIRNHHHRTVPSTSEHINVSTNFKKINNFKCSFNFNLNVNLKFSVSSKENLISNKYLIMTVYYSHKQDLSELNKNFGKDNTRCLPILSEYIELGSLEVNLAEYLNFDSPITNKYLLHDSKINSILNLTIFLKPIDDANGFNKSININESNTDTFSEASSASLAPSKTFNIPQFERKNVFKGITGVMENDEANSGSSVMSRESSKNTNGKPEPKKVTIDDKQAKMDKKMTKYKLILDPMVSRLYNKIFENSWYGANEATPEECINDIFNGGDGFIDQYKDSKAEDDIDDLNGLLSETNVREDLKSWTINVK